MKIIIFNFKSKADKKEFVASIYAALNEFLDGNKHISFQIKEGTNLNTISEGLRGFADIVDCAKDFVSGDDGDDEEHDAADWWKEDN